MTSVSIFNYPGQYITLICLFFRDVVLFPINPTLFDDGLYSLKFTACGWILQNTWLIFAFGHLDLYYKQFLCCGHTYYLNQLQSAGVLGLFTGFRFLGTALKLFLLLFISSLILHLNSLDRYVTHLKGLNYYLRFFLLHESEKEIGQVDDIFQFIILFLVTIISFILGSIGLFFFLNDTFTWPFIAILLVSFLILTTPLNLLVDFGIAFIAYVKGAGTSSVLFKEVLFDIISTSIVFIRFLIQNIRFLFIFLAIFELFEWAYTNNSFLFSIFLVKVEFGFYAVKVTSLDLFTIFTFFLNFITATVLYLYYFLHLLFLLIVQVSIYVGILLWLFFFLYSTRFSTKHESFFKIN